MAREGKPVEIPSFPGLSGVDAWRAEDEWYAEWSKGKDIVRFQIADGYAKYLVTPSRTTLKHIPIGDGYRIPAAYVRGLTKTDIERHLGSQRALAELFGGR